MGNAHWNNSLANQLISLSISTSVSSTGAGTRKMPASERRRLDAGLVYHTGLVLLCPSGC